ncbi:MAG: glutamine--fructose-6-phosphate transaminase (isomerizing) [Candidatus Rokuibacteriota bacterium]|nr:MAG: glutamine--fructose-6-phosphate transaminase (isomerizing) [Candidatus Rokubacteria bacterium]
MCGIFGYVGTDQDAADIVLRGLKKLEYRGYDSWGVAVGHRGRVTVDKRIGKIGDAAPELPASGIGIGHTRWATHGGVTEQNAHPHLDCGGRLALIHNGIVSNYAELRSRLTRAGHVFRSETDTEVIAHLVEEALDRTPSGPERLLAATTAAFRQLRGLNAIAVLDVEGHQLAAAKSGSPLVIGWSDHGHMLASDYSALLEHTRRVTFVEDRQAALLTAETCRVFDADTDREVAPGITEVQWEAAATELSGYPDYMTKEIHEQPAVLRGIAGGSGEDVQRLAAMLREATDVFAIGCGTASYAALTAQYLLARIAGRRVTVISGSEFPYLCHFVRDGSVVLALSQSGETIDVIDAARAAHERGARVAAIVNVEGSTLWRLADLTVPLGAGPERCVLATKSFTAKLAILLMTAYELHGQTEHGVALVERAADEIERLLADDRRDLIRTIAEKIYTREHLFVIGRGPSYPLALEAALKVKEVSYLHAEGFAGGDLKHGVIALIEPGTPCLVLAPRDETYDDILAGAMQVKARGGMLIGISPEPHDAFDYHLPVADLGPATAILNAPPAQLLGYYLALLRGHDPDKPRNLAKSVTVK